MPKSDCDAKGCGSRAHRTNCCEKDSRRMDYGGYRDRHEKRIEVITVSFSGMEKETKQSDSAEDKRAVRAAKTE